MDSKEIKPVNPKEINPEYSLEGLVLKCQYIGHLMPGADSLKKTSMLGKIEGKRGRGQQRVRWFDGIIDSVDMKLGELQKMVRDREAWRAPVHGSQRVGHSLAIEQDQQGHILRF